MAKSALHAGNAIESRGAQMLGMTNRARAILDDI
jgi:hypothetical protein